LGDEQILSWTRSQKDERFNPTKQSTLKTLACLVFVSFLCTLLLSGGVMSTNFSEPVYVGAKESVTGSRKTQRKAAAPSVETVSQAEVSLFQVSGISSSGRPACP
jgi:hypothetical protein